MGACSKLDLGPTIHFDSVRFGCPRADVRFGSEADICSAIGHVRFTPIATVKADIRKLAMSALPPKADMCSALAHVGYGPEADMSCLFDQLIGAPD
jgi:hypothetical protein